MLVSVVSGLLLGSTRIALSEIVDVFFNGFNSAGVKILGFVRLPRVLAAVVCGAALSVSGAVIQNVLANRLASPSIIGVNSGAGLAIVLCMSFGIYGGLQISFFSFLGAFAAVMLVSLGAKSFGASRSTVILIGIALNSFISAISDTIITFNPEVGAMSNDFKIGELSGITYQRLIPATIIICITIILLISIHNDLDVIALGEDNAMGLGMNISLMRTIFLLIAALLAGCAVSIAGLLSFVGLIVPHTIRRLIGNKAFHLIGMSALYGGAFVCLCDTVARTAFSPYEIPVGIIMAFLGTPFFVFLLVRGKGGRKDI